jgi:hypothetical protein
VGLGYKKPLRITTRPADEKKQLILNTFSTFLLDVLRRIVESVLQVAAICAKCCGLFEISH